MQITYGSLRLLLAVIMIFLTFNSLSNISEFICRKNTVKKGLYYVLAAFVFAGTAMNMAGIPFHNSAMFIYVALTFLFIILFSFSFVRKDSALYQILGLIGMLLLLLSYYTSVVIVQAQYSNEYYNNIIIYCSAYVLSIIAFISTGFMKNPFCKLIGIITLYFITLIYILSFFSSYSDSVTRLSRIYDTLYYCTNFEKNGGTDNLKLIRIFQYFSFSLLKTVTVTLSLSLAYDLWVKKQLKT